MSMLLDSATTAATSGMGLFSVVWIIVLLAVMYFMMIKPQQKEQREKSAMMASLAVGDTVLTTSGFYGVVIDIDEDTVIVEFGSNRNCRIPMQKAAIAQLEKPEDAKNAQAAEEKDRKKEK